MLNDINQWWITDRYPEVPLANIFPISQRAACLIARNKTNVHLKTEFIRIQGAAEMMMGLDYHYDNHMSVIAGLAQVEFNGPEAKELHANLLHEVTAYLNRLGQFYYFIISDFVQKTCPAVTALSPTIEKYVIFRNKHSAHRSIDAPRKESSRVQMVQAISMSAVGGKLFKNKPGFNRPPLPTNTVAEMEAYLRENWIKCYLVFQLLTDDPNIHHNFSVEKEHPIIMQEAYTVLANILK